MPTQRQEKYEKRLSSILRAASKVIAKDGYDGASVRDVAAKGKIGLSGIYYYFKSKDEMLFAIQHHAFSTLVRQLKERLQDTASPEERLKAVIDNHFQFFVNNMDEFRVCVHEMESLSGKYYKSVLKTRQEYFSLVRKVVGEVYGRSPSETDLATLFLFGSLNWVYMWFDPEKNADIDELSDQWLRVFLNGINKT
ncbi:MAG: TetR family transcriptional regulator [Candidatus Zixiibacteriota bacterium]|nr:MAG: TetR family transcriptional regulator [candidate division Zixibacteria bacterium]